MSKAHKLHRLAMEKIYNKPLLIVQEALTPILDYLENRDDSLSAAEAAIVSDESNRYSQAGIAETVGFIPIHGSLSYEKTWLGALCGMTSYQQLLEDVEMLIDQGAKTIVLDQNSGGGECYGCFETARAIRKRADAAGIRIIAYVDGMSASASYALSAIADEVVSNPSSSTGSIGVLVRLLDQSEAMKKAGYSQIFITSAKSKVPYDKDGKFKQEFLDELQADVDDLHQEFLSHVSEYRGMSTDDINALEAKVFNAKEALSIGLIDKIMTHDEFAEYLATLEDNTPKMPLSFFKTTAKASATAINEEEAMQLAELQTQYNELSAKLQASVDSVTKLESDLMEAMATVDEKDAELSAALSELENIKAEKAQAALDAKKAKLSAVAGDSVVEELFDTYAQLPDAAFDKIVASYELANKQQEAVLGKEVGVTAEAEAPTPITQEQYLEQRLRAQKTKQNK